MATVRRTSLSLSPIKTASKVNTSPIRTAYSPGRKGDIARKDDAIRRKLNLSNLSNENKARDTARKTGKNTSYTTQRILGQKEGFSNSDYGVGAGAAIPYQIKTETKTAADRVVKGPPASTPSPRKAVSRGTNPNAKMAAIQRRLTGPAK